MIQIIDISKKFKKCLALENVNFDVKNGEIIGLLGENGAGKSTLLRILSTMLVPTSGTAIINDCDLIVNPSEIRRHIGILFGNEVGLYERLTVRENLEYFAKLNDMNKTETNERIEALSEQFNFTDYIKKIVGTISRGMKQKVAIARAIVHNPNIILFDEPDSGLDFKAAKIVFDFLNFCKDAQKSVIFSSHSMENIKKFSDRIVVLHKGRVVSNFDMQEYAAKYTEKEINSILFDLVCEDDENV
jgi:sodium transport system ATP-binding protein